MRHALHEFLWLVRRWRLALAAHALLWVGLTWTSWAYNDESGSRRGFLTLHIGLIAMTGMLALAAGEAAPAVGTNTFWRTRPPRWRSLWLAQVLYVFVALAGPALVCWTVNGLLLDQTAAQWRAGLMFPAVLLSALLVLTALRSLADGWGEGVGVLLVWGGLIAAGVSLQWLLEERIQTVGQPFFGRQILTTDLAWFICIAFTVPAAGMAVVWLARMRRHLMRWNLFAAGAWLVLAPPLVWRAMHRARATKFSLVASAPGESPRPGERVLGLLKLQGVPQDRELIGLHPMIDATWPDLPEPDAEHYLPMLNWPGYHTNWLTRGAGEHLRGQFPGTTRWYSNATNEAVTPGFELYDWEWHEPLRAKLTGYVMGQLTAPARGFVVKLEAGAAAARDGTHLRITEVKPGIRNLRLHLEVRHSFSDFHDEHDHVALVFVLHLPALPAALLISASESLAFHSIQCSGDHRVLDVSMPDAEMAADARFTPEVLRGAELWHFAPGEETPFIAEPAEEISTLHPSATQPSPPP